MSRLGTLHHSPRSYRRLSAFYLFRLFHFFYLFFFNFLCFWTKQQKSRFHTKFRKIVSGILSSQWGKLSEIFIVGKKGGRTTGCTCGRTDSSSPIAASISILGNEFPLVAIARPIVICVRTANGAERVEKRSVSCRSFVRTGAKNSLGIPLLILKTAKIPLYSTRSRIDQTRRYVLVTRRRIPIFQFFKYFFFNSLDNI